MPICNYTICDYSDWHSDEDYYNSSITNSTFIETEHLTDLVNHTNDTCLEPQNIECRVVGNETDFSETGQEVHCDVHHGLTCTYHEKECSDYEIRVECCKVIEAPCATLPIGLYCLVFI